VEMHEHVSSTMAKPEPASHTVVDAGEVPRVAVVEHAHGFAVGEDGKWNLAEATSVVFPFRFPTLATARKAVRRGEIAVLVSGEEAATSRRAAISESRLDRRWNSCNARGVTMDAYWIHIQRISRNYGSRTKTTTARWW
jgi:hypothetical protein